jgi:hypothetical protein
MIIYEVKLVCPITKKVIYLHVGEKIKLPSLEEARKNPGAQLVINTLSSHPDKTPVQPKAA